VRQLLLKTIFAGVFTLSLALKVFGNTAQVQTATEDMPAIIGQYMEQHGFTLTQQRTVSGSALVATSGPCRIEIADVSPHGWHRSAMAQHASGRQLAYLYDGSVYADQPVALSKFGFYWHKLIRYFMPSSTPAVLAVITSPECSSEAANLDRLALLAK
jgi:hypothetical protein